MTGPPRTARRDRSRRGVLTGTGLALASLALGGCIEGGPAEDRNGDEDVTTRFVLQAEATGWIGVEPSDIEGQRNPALRLTEGAEHELVWENGDGVAHNFVLEDEDGRAVVESEVVDEEGETYETTFSASANLATYYCEFHPDQMVGGVEIEN